MPYIKQEDRECLERITNTFHSGLESGDLNYLITKLLLAQKPERYEDFNRLMGVLESCKIEFYRRHVVPYENLKVKENGDV